MSVYATHNNQDTYVVWPGQKVKGIQGWEYHRMDAADHPWNFTTVEMKGTRHSFDMKYDRGESWTLVILLLVLAVLAYLRVSKTKRLNQFVESFYSNRFVDQLIREEGFLGSVVNLYLLVNAVLVISLFGYQLVRLYLEENCRSDVMGIQFYWICFFAVSVFFLFKLILYGVSSLLLHLKDHFSEYIFQYFLFLQAAGIFLFPVVLGIEFMDQFSAYSVALVGVSVVSIVFVVRQIKVFYLSVVNTSFSPLYIILYLCTLEFLPLLVLSKFVMNNLAFF